MEADREACDAITAGAPESLIHAAGREGADAAPLAAFATGPGAISATQTAFGYIHPPADGPSSPRDAERIVEPDGVAHRSNPAAPLQPCGFAG